MPCARSTRVHAGAGGDAVDHQDRGAALRLRLRAPGQTECAPALNILQMRIAPKRKEFAITDADDNAIAAAAIIGDRRSPVIG